MWPSVSPLLLLLSAHTSGPAGGGGPAPFHAHVNPTQAGAASHAAAAAAGVMVPSCSESPSSVVCATNV